MTYVVGIDPSLTSTAVCSFYTSAGVVNKVYSSSPATGVRERVRRYSELCNNVLHQSGVGADVIAIEGYSFMSKGGLQLDRIEYGGILRYLLATHCPQTRIVEIPPTTLKLFTVGSGAANKEAMAVAAFKRWGVEFKTNDETDAYALARLAACIAGFDQPANDAQKRAIDSVLHGKPKKPKHPQPAE